MPQWKKNLIILWVTQVLSLMGFNFVLPFLPYYIQELGVHDPNELRLWTGLLSAAPALSFAIMAPIWGLVADRWGRKMMILRAMIAGGVLMASYALAGNVHTVFTLRIIQGFFTGTIAAATTLVAAGTPVRRLSFALGFLSSSNFIGISIGPLVGGICAELFGYRPTFIIGGSILLTGAVVVSLFVRELAFEEDPADPAGPPPLKAPVIFGLKNLFTLPFITLFVLLFLLRLSRSIAMPFIPLYIQEVRGTIQGTPTIMGIISAGAGLVTALAGISLGKLGDKGQKERLIIFFFIAGAVLTLPISFMGSLIGFSGFYIVSSFFLGGVEPLIQSSLSLLTPARKKGMVFGIQTTIGSLGWFTAPLLGSMVSISFGINEVFLARSFVLFLSWGAACLLFGKLRRKKLDP